MSCQILSNVCQNKKKQVETTKERGCVRDLHKNTCAATVCELFGFKKSKNKRKRSHYYTVRYNKKKKSHTKAKTKVFNVFCNRFFSIFAGVRLRILIKLNQNGAMWGAGTFCTTQEVEELERTVRYVCVWHLTIESRELLFQNLILNVNVVIENNKIRRLDLYNTGIILNVESIQWEIEEPLFCNRCWDVNDYYFRLRVKLDES